MPGDNAEIMLFCVTGKASKMSAISWNSRILFSHGLHDRRVLHSSPMDAGSQVTPRDLILHCVIADPCSAVTFQWAQKLMSHFYSGRSGLPIIHCFSFSWERQFILKKIVMTSSMRLVLWNEDVACAVLFLLLLNPSRRMSWIHFGAICVHSCVCSFIQLLWVQPRCLGCICHFYT